LHNKHTCTEIRFSCSCHAPCILSEMGCCNIYCHHMLLTHLCDTCCKLHHEIHVLLHTLLQVSACVGPFS
jgi:hypothetical protein